MADPIADKLLVGSVVLLFVAREVNPIFAGFIVLIELMIAGGAIYRKRRGIMSSANEFGKIKMFLQVTGVAVLLAAKLFGMPTAVPFAVGTLSVAIVFAIVSLFTYGI
jgi:phosphatidylglycerophosphate synthase